MRKYCENCGSIHKVEFHHANPFSKVCNVSFFSNRGIATKALKEIDKCIILCRSCHFRLHGLISSSIAKEITRGGLFRLNKLVGKLKRLY